jgi:hypothetical protein
MTEIRRMRNTAIFRRLIAVLLLTCAQAFGSHTEAPNVALSEIHQSVALTGNWQFHWGDDLNWASPDYDDRSWQEASVPQRWPTNST